MRSSVTRWILTAGLLGTILLGYVQLSTALHSTPHYYDVLEAGQGQAPEQYRVMVLHISFWLTAHVPGMPLYRSITLLSAAGLLFAGFTLLGLLERAPIFQKADEALQWLGSAVFVMLLLFYLQWVGWYYRPDTLVSAGFLAAMYWLWAFPAEKAATVGRRLLIAAGLLALALLQGFARSDIAVALFLGVLLASAAGVGGLSLPRRWALPVCVLGMAVAVGVLLYMSKVVYPQASYGDSKKFMLLMNAEHWEGTFPFLLFSLPLFWTAIQGWKRRGEIDGPALAMLTSAAVFMAMWLTLGKDDEVRIFMGFALMLAPLTSQMVMRRAQDGMAANPGGSAGAAGF